MEEKNYRKMPYDCKPLLYFHFHFYRPVCVYIKYAFYFDFHYLDGWSLLFQFVVGWYFFSRCFSLCLCFRRKCHILLPLTALCVSAITTSWKKIKVCARFNVESFGSIKRHEMPSSWWLFINRTLPKTPNDIVPLYLSLSVCVKFMNMPL